MADLQPLLVENFDGGVTDYFVAGDPAKNQTMDNFYINENRDCFTRPGFRSAFNTRIATTAITNIIDNQKHALHRAGNKVYDIPVATPIEITSPQGHSVFTSGTASSKASFTYWNKHTFAVSDAFAPVQRIYKNAAGTWQTMDLGLPEISYPTAIALANDLKAKINAHMASVTIHTVAADTAHTITSPAATDLPTLMTLVGELLTKYDAHQGDADLASGRLYHGGMQAVTHKLSTHVAPETLFGAYTALVELKAAYNAHDAAATAHGVTGSQASGALVPTVTGTAGANSYIYGAHFTYRYTAEDTTFVEKGVVQLIQVTSLAAPDASVITFANIPALASGTGHNWDDANVTISIYRTTNNGSTLYFLGDVANGVASYVDNLSDTNLLLRQPAYTEGGILDNDMPPPAKFAESVGGILCLANVKEGAIVRSYRVRFSGPDKPYSMPQTSYLDFEDAITGFSSIGVYPIVFLNNKIYRVEGGIDSQGRGGFIKREISSKVGCISNASIIKTGSGLYFASVDGFFFTDGFNFRKVSHDLKKTYPTLLNSQDICGAYDAKNNWAIWSAQTNSSSLAHDTLYVAHIDRNDQRGGHPFTTWSGGRDPLNFTATALAYINGVFYRGDNRGYTLYHDSSFQDDSYIDTAITPSLWATQTIFYSLVSVAFDFGNPNARKWVSKITINAENTTSISLDMQSSNDHSGIYASLRSVVNQGVPEWGDATIIWGVSTIRWNFFPVISEWRHMPASTQNLRCMFKQIKFQNAYTDIDNSTYSGAASVTPLGGTARIDTLTANSWIPDAVNYYISFASQAYAIEYKILSRTATSLVVQDTSNQLATAATAQWKIKGYKKREVLNLLNYVLLYQTITRTQTTTHTATP